MGDMNGNIQVFRQHDVAHGLHCLARRRLALDAQQAAGHAFVHAPSLGKVRVFAMVYKHKAQVGSIFHDAPHNLCILQRAAIVGNGHAARFLEFGQRRHLFALEADGCGGYGEQARPVRVTLACAVQHESGDAGRIVDGLCVGHAHDCAKAAARGGFQTGSDVFLVFKAGFAQMHVGVDATGHEHKPLRVENLAAGRGLMVSGRGHGDNFAVIRQQIHRGFKVTGVFDVKAHARPPSLRVASR